MPYAEKELIKECGGQVLQPISNSLPRTAMNAAKQKRRVLSHSTLTDLHTFSLILILDYYYKSIEIAKFSGSPAGEVIHHTVYLEGV